MDSDAVGQEQQARVEVRARVQGSWIVISFPRVLATEHRSAGNAQQLLSNVVVIRFMSAIPNQVILLILRPSHIFALRAFRAIFRDYRRRVWLSSPE